jgi:hypothetical protein
LTVGWRAGAACTRETIVAPRETPPPKKDIARHLLLRGSVFVYLDPRAPAVRVPEWLASQPQLVLQIGLDLPVPIPDLRVVDAGIFGTLSFNRAPFTCAVPWDAVFALVGDDGMGMVWSDAMPEEIAAEVEQAEKKARSASKQARGGGPRLRAIEGGASEPAPAEPPSAEPTAAEHDEAAPKRPPHLRLIK